VTAPLLSPSASRRKPSDPRPCLKCQVVKPPEAFDRREKDRSRDRVCRECVAARPAWELWRAERQREAAARRRAAAALDPTRLTAATVLPVLPLCAKIRVWAGRNGWTLEEACKRLGMGARLFNQWEAQGVGRFRKVDAVLCASPWLWFDIWGEDDPEFRRVRALFTGRA
jgi:hypothetical protein